MSIPGVLPPRPVRHRRSLPFAVAIWLAAMFGARPLAGQIDYRNLDAGRPVGTEDAYPIERYAFELVVAYAYHADVTREKVHAVMPELSYGVLANTQVGVAVPLAVLDNVETTVWGSAGPRLFALYNINTEGRTLPALALRADMALPLGPLGGDELRGSLGGLATRSWGRTRAHLNAAIGWGGDGAVTAVEPIPDWLLGAAIDRSFLRQSLLVIGEVAVRRTVSGAPAEVALGAGARWQLAPTFVLDAGMHRRLTEAAGPDLALTLGLSHAFAWAGLMPFRRPGARP